MVETDRSQVGDLARRLFADLADPQSILAGHEGWHDTLWEALEDAMLPRAWAAEGVGGAGLTAWEAGQIAEAAGAFALGVPLVETMVAHHWAARAGLALPAGPIGVGPSRLGDRIVCDDGGRLTGVMRDLPWESGPLMVAVEHGDVLVLALVEREQCVLQEQPGLSGDQRVVARLNNVMPMATGETRGAQIDLQSCAAAMRATQIGGALRWVLDAAVVYAGERRAFGRTLSKFQAVQHHLARLAGEVCAAEVGAGVALQALDRGGANFEAAAAKVRADEAATEGAAIGHQVFGAIGFTAEHVLHRYTTRLLAWRDDYGSGPEWAAYLGRLAASSGGDGFWNKTAPLEGVRP
ncbi:MAG: acyl-CoA dehydrogenase family protein [Alphaproteobacteria bacterium]|jgi:acyl-CoA dehydrogenase|nr:acyl-CoA dehydrogenase [Rhodospirillaceae bacterium]MBT6206369.1 acyl-CoA dehydrogenase [Rhodospirillaceae bacterium]MBT6508977.1 acyl-CoA dehydrogenase [Rhodospirillaceae bacterium]MBT7646499.1 acyl-CoA dehydrogenase [Rhodospirillaceae bacterium]MDG2483338.1 acyl-CoA dehydrogenase family protein [Alphaproteobacteria bacterium]